MSLERDHVLLYGPKVRREDGLRIRNKVLQPCGCWSGDVWREVSPPTGITAVEPVGGRWKKEAAKRRAWCQETRQCAVHSAKVAVLSLKLAERLGGAGFTEKIGDGARRLLADAERVFADAEALDRELLALTDPDTKQLPEKKKR